MGVDDIERRGVIGWLYHLKRRMYRTGRPDRLARVLNRMSAIQFAAGVLSPQRAVTIEVRGRRTGRTIAFPVVVTEYEGQRFVVSMLGNGAQWVRNVHAADGRAVLRRGHRENIRLREIEPALRPPILRRYLDLAPGARPHLPVDRHAPLCAFEAIADEYPVFRLDPAEATR